MSSARIAIRIHIDVHDSMYHMLWPCLSSEPSLRGGAAGPHITGVRFRPQAGVFTSAATKGFSPLPSRAPDGSAAEAGEVCPGDSSGQLIPRARAAVPPEEYTGLTLQQRRAQAAYAIHLATEAGRRALATAHPTPTPLPPRRMLRYSLAASSGHGVRAALSE